MNARFAAFLRLFVPLAALLVGGAWLLLSVLSTVQDYSPAAVGAVVLLLLAFVGFAIDRFQKAVAHEAESNSQFKVFFERAMVGVAKTSPGKRWLLVNPALCRMLGYAEEELLQKTWSELTFPGDLGDNTANFERVLRGEAEGYTLEKRFVRKDGSIIHTLIAAGCVRKADRSVDYFVVSIEDITERKLATIQLEENQAQLRSLSDNLPESYLYQYTVAADGRPVFLYVSSGVTRVHGLLPQAVMASSAVIFDLVHPDDVLPLRTAAVASAETLSKFFSVMRIRRADGNWGWLQLQSFPHRTPSGSVVWDGVATDVTERHENELALQHITKRFETLLELPQKAEVLGECELMKYAIEQAEALTGSTIAFIHLVRDDQETIELAAWSTNPLANDSIEAEDRHSSLSAAGIWADAARQQKAVLFNDCAGSEDTRGLPEGLARLTRFVCVPVIEDGKVRMMAGVGNKASDYAGIDVDSLQLIANFIWRLVSKRKADLALQIASRVVNASSVVCFRWRAEAGWPVAFVSENVRQWGYDADALLAGKPSFGEMIHPDDLAQVEQEVAEHTAAGRSPYFQEYRIVTRGGKIRWVVDETMVIRTADGRVEFYDGVLSDITDRKFAEESLSQSLTDQQALNKQLEQANSQLLQVEKMASIGQLAAGVAHELNNPIGFVHSNLGTLEGYLHDLMFIVESYEQAFSEGCVGDAARTRMGQIRKERDFEFLREDIFPLVAESRDGLDRLRRIVLDLKTFSRTGTQEREYANLNQGIESTLNIVWNELKYKCKLTKELGALPPVYCHISQINQVFLNLLVNAGQAIEEKGEITLRTCRIDDNQVMIEVVDSGKGIPPENLRRIFDPFFTTKPVGTGTGLGLSLSCSIIQAHHGRIEVDSQLGHGTTFRVILPVAPPLTPPPTPEGDSSGKLA